MDFCTSCGAKSAGKAFCTSCGAAMSTPAADATLPPPGSNPPFEKTQARIPGQSKPPEPGQPVVAETVVRGSATPPPPLQPPAPRPVSPAGPVLPPVVPPAPVQWAPTPPRRGTSPWVIVLTVVLLIALGGGIGAGIAFMGNSNDDPAAPTAAAPTTAPAPQATATAPQPAPTVTVTATPEPTQAPVVYECPDGSTRPDSGRCDTTSAEAAARAFGIDLDSCSGSKFPATHATNALNLDCPGGVHLAAYKDAPSREQRLREYGLGRGGCTNDSMKRAVCGPTKTNRYVRTYASTTGIMFYASTTGPGIKNHYQMPANELMYGTAR